MYGNILSCLEPCAIIIDKRHYLIHNLIFEGIKPIYLANCIHYIRVQVDVSGAVSREDLYVIVAEYYQPNHPALSLRVNVSNTVSADRAGGDQVAATDFLPGK